MERRTLVFFHAHPDDESIATGGTMIKAADAGHRVVLVVGTRGENGEVEEGFLGPDEPLWQRRVQETHAAAAVLGARRVEFLDYVDSGMIGTPENEHPESFWQADVEEAARRLADILVEERADVLSIYDENGVYGHPDHIQVHRVGARAGELAGTARVFMSTVDKDRMMRLMKEASESGDLELPGDLDAEEFELGVPAERITTRIDVTDVCDRKRRAMAAHASQISETSFFLAMKSEHFQAAFGEEAYIFCGPPDGAPADGLLEGL